MMTIQLNKEIVFILMTKNLVQDVLDLPAQKNKRIVIKVRGDFDFPTTYTPIPNTLISFPDGTEELIYKASFDLSKGTWEVFFLDSNYMANTKEELEKEQYEVEKIYRDLGFSVRHW